MSSEDDIVEALFREHLERADRGESVDEAGLLARAGEQAGELSKRFAALREIEALAVTFEGDDRDEGAHMARLGRFENLRRIGFGGSARVFVAHDPHLGREVALKILDLGPGEERAWLEREGRALARISHSGVVGVFDLGEAEGRTFITMEFLRGPTLASVIDSLRRARTSPEDGETDAATRRFATIEARTRLALALADALSTCHESGVLHRDVKPHNVVLDGDTEPKWIDFGLAHADGLRGSESVAERFLATPAYAAPEQLELAATGASHACDQWSFGVLLYELLTLEHPFLRATRAATLEAIEHAAPKPPRAIEPALARDLEAIVLRSLERDPRRRYASMRALTSDLDAFLAHRPVRARPLTRGQRGLLWTRRYRRDLRLASAALAIVSGVAFAGALTTNAREDRAFFGALAAVSQRAATTPFDFADKYEHLGALARDAERLDRRWVGLTGLSDLAHAAIEDLSQAMSQSLRARWEECGGAAPEQVTHLRRELVLAFRAALSRDEELCPTCPWNAIDRERGRVTRPKLRDGETLLVWRFRPLERPGAGRLEPLPPDARLDIGVYRAQRIGTTGAIESDIEFEVRPEDPSRELVLPSIDPGVRAKCVSVDEWIATSDDVRGERVCAFKISRSPLSWSDLRDAGPSACSQFAALRAQIARRLGEAAIAEDAPALLCANDAREIATRWGARLPTLLELDAARARGVLADSYPQHVLGEHVSGPGAIRARIGARFDGTLAELDEHTVFRRTESVDGAFTLRLAFEDRP